MIADVTTKLGKSVQDLRDVLVGRSSVCFVRRKD